MVMMGAYAAVSGLVAVNSLCPAVEAALPSYRTQHIAINADALRRGYESVAS